MFILNGLTPVFFVTLFQLTLGNLVLELLESYCIMRFFRLQPRTPLIIVGNYISAIIGFIVSATILDSTELNLIRGYTSGEFIKSLLAYTGVAFVITLIIEFPFYYFGIRCKNDDKVQIREVAKILIIVHIISYIFTVVLLGSHF